ncbi:FIG00677416: hypothetical protein [hydrothermal vent metagenome]|uniref:Uncharacterized protein n=1 Tax=hydrothermal vent metagenome TaxID=652676 RepID=A0A3B0QW73_9ZZZZ
MKLVDNPESAARLARTIVSDVALYNKEKVEEGIKNDNIFELLKDELAEGEEHYRSRVVPELLKTTDFYNTALVDVLIKRSGKIESEIW